MRTGGDDPSGGSTPEPAWLVGLGYDLHRLEPMPPTGPSIGPGQPVRPFILGGERIAHTHGVVAHSDGDTLLHAITDALLGAIGDDDIGQVFPDTDAAHAGRDSMEFLVAAVERVSRRGYRVSNLDATVILERPKLAPHKREIRRRIAAVLGCPEARVNIKGKTHEKVDAVGEGRAVEVHCVVLLVRAAGHDAHA